MPATSAISPIPASHASPPRPLSSFTELKQAMEALHLTRHQSARIDELVQTARANPTQAPNAQETAELLCQAIRSRKDEGIKEKLASLPRFDANMTVQGRSLLAIAAEANDRPFCVHLLQKGANPKNIEDKLLKPDIVALLHAAKVIHTMALEAPPGNGLPPIEHALAKYEMPKARELLERKTGTGIKLNTVDNMKSMWARAMEGKRSDWACAILALSPKEWIDALYEEKDEYGRSTLEQGLHLSHRGLKNVIKKYPYYPPYMEPVESANCKVRFSTDSRYSIVCNTIAPFAAHLLLRHHENKAIVRQRKLQDSPLSAKEKVPFDPSPLSKEKLPKHVPFSMRHAGEKLLQASSEVYIVPNSRLQKFPSEIFRSLDEEKSWTGGTEETRIKPMCSLTANHAITLLFEIKKDASDRKKFVFFMHDPNGDFPYKRLEADNLEEAEQWSPESFFKNGKEDVSDYRMDSGGSLVFSYPEGALDALMAGGTIEPLDHAERRVADLPPGDDIFTGAILRLLLKGGLNGTWIDLQPRLRSHVQNLSEEEIIATLGGTGRIRNIFLAFIAKDEDASSAFAYLDGVKNLPKPDALKLKLITHNSDVNTLLRFACPVTAKRILEFIDDLAIPLEEKFDAFFTPQNDTDESALDTRIRDPKIVKEILGFMKKMKTAGIADEKLFEELDLTIDDFPMLSNADAEVTEEVLAFAEELNVSHDRKRNMVLKNGKGALQGDDSPEKARAIFNFVNKLGIKPEEKIEVAKAISFDYRVPVLAVANTELTGVILNEFVAPLEMNDENRKGEVVLLSPDESEEFENVFSVKPANILGAVFEEYPAKAKIIIGFLRQLKISAHAQTELMEGKKIEGTMPPLCQYLYNGETSQALEISEAVLEMMATSANEEERNEIAKMILALDKDGIPSAIHACDNGHVGTVGKYQEILGNSSMKDHPYIVAVLKEIEKKLSELARGVKRNATPTPLPGQPPTQIT